MLHGVLYESLWVMTSGGVVGGSSGGTVPPSGAAGGETVPGWLLHGPGRDQDPTTETYRPVVTPTSVGLMSKSVCRPSSPPSVQSLVMGYCRPPASVKPNRGAV